MSGKRGAGDEENEDLEGILEVPWAESLPISTVVSTVPVPVDDFMHTIEFKRHFAPFVHEQTLMALSVFNKEWNGVADVLINEGERSGTMMVHDGRDFSFEVAYARRERRALVTRMVFLLNLTKVGENACYECVNLVVVDMPEGVESIGDNAFQGCRGLTIVSFPITLTSIANCAFGRCRSLDNVDLLHTNLQVLTHNAFYVCSELKSMTIPDSLQTIGIFVFLDCFKLVPSSIDVRGVGSEGKYLPDPTIEVVAHLRSKQQAEAEQAEADRIKQEADQIKQEKNDARARRLQQRQGRQEKQQKP